MDNKSLKTAIISGVIATLIVTIFIQPILGFVWNAFMAIVGTIHQGYVDRIYRNAALGERNSVGEATFIILMLFILGSIFSNFLYVVGEAATSPSFLRRTFSAGNRARIDSGFEMLIVLLSFVLLVTFSLSTGITEISASFTQRLTVLAPAISDGEYKTLKARWANMRTKADYDALVAAMDKRAAELSVPLPPVRKP
jgi:hypothetical protein